mgnify:CR=1 FL=1
MNSWSLLKELRSFFYNDLKYFINENFTSIFINKCKKLDVVEIDRDLAKQLKQKFLTERLLAQSENNKLTIYQQDVLDFDFSQYESDSSQIRLIGNLPYNISTPIIFKLLKTLKVIEDMHFMLQKEIVDRLISVPGSKTYGRLSVMIQYYCKLRKLIDVPPDAFDPKPKVHSAFVHLVPHKVLPCVANDFAKFELTTRVAFTKRRKTILNALKGYVTRTELEKLNINPVFRPEQLSVSDFVNISNIAKII